MVFKSRAARMRSGSVSGVGVGLETMGEVGDPHCRSARPGGEEEEDEEEAR